MIAALRAHVARTLREVDEARAPGPTLDRELVAVVVVAAVGATIVKEIGHANGYMALRWPLFLFTSDPDAALFEVFRKGPYAGLLRQAYWAGMVLAAYVVLPLVVVRRLRGSWSLASLGLSPRGAIAHWRIYAVLFAIVFPFILVVGQMRGFTKYYPIFPGAADGPLHFVGWELAYGLQFFAVEFFYRGLLVLGVARKLGAAAVLFPVIPYCMLHFGKPLPEVLGSILAGVVLAYLSLSTRTIWLGVALHVGVAVLMDVVALAAKGKLPF